MLKSLGLWKNKSASEVYYSEEHPLERDEEKRVSLVEAGSADQHDQDGSDMTITGDGDGGGCARAWEQWELQDLGLAYGPQVLKLW